MDEKALRKRFCKDNNISIQLFDDPFFEDRLRLMGQLSNWKEFCKLIATEFNGNEELYFSEYNKLKDNIINFIKESAAFKKLNADDMNKYQCKYNLSQRDIYKDTNVGKRFISIDMKKANFSSLVHYGRVNLCPFNNDYNWEQFMEQFTDIRHFINSKYIRQVVFGNCNPRRQVTYEKYLMSLVIERLLDDNIITTFDIYSLTNDEIIINAGRFDNETIEEIINKVENTFEIPLKVEYFILGRIKGSSAYIKEITDFYKYNGGIAECKRNVVKCITSIEAPAIYRMLMNEPETEDDKYFLHEGRLAKYQDNIKYEITFKQGE